MTDLTHLNALQRRKADEIARLAAATNPAEIEMRKVWVAQIIREITAEMDFLEQQYAKENPLPA